MQVSENTVIGTLARNNLDRVGFCQEDQVHALSAIRWEHGKSEYQVSNALFNFLEHIFYFKTTPLELMIQMVFLATLPFRYKSKVQTSKI